MISDDERTPLMPSNMTASVSDEHILQTLLTWLNMSNDREERRFLEVHSELLTSESLHILNGLLKESPHGKERVIRDHLKLLRDALDRGGSVMAIREAYVNTHGGWNLDLPPWLEEVKRQYDHLLALGPSKSTAAARVELLQTALAQARQDAPLTPEVVASLYCKLGTALWDDDHADRGRAVEAMIHAVQTSLQGYTRSRYPYMYALRQNDLGMAYRNRAEGDQSANIEQAIAHYEEALTICTCDTYPEEYAKIQYNLGIAYLHRSEGEQGADVERAITCFTLALQVYDEDTFPVEWAWIHYYLGIAYYERAEGEREENLEQAIACYGSALRIKTQDAFPQEWADTQSNLGLTYRFRIQGERSQNQERAIACYKAALQVYTPDVNGQ